MHSSNIRFFLIILTLSLLTTPIAIAQTAQTVTLTLPSQTLWETWRPTNNNYALFFVNIKGATSQGTVTFHLDNVSRWVGYCMNDGDSTAPDLELDEDDQDKNYGLDWQSSSDKQQLTAEWDSETTQTWLSTSTGEGTFTIKVSCLDYAAYGTLYARFGTAEAHFDIPLDTNGDHIADGWQTAANGWDSMASAADPAGYAKSDLEAGPGANLYPGDGFVVFEEYRGFMVKDNWTDTRVDKKDLFIFSEFDTAAEADPSFPKPAGYTALADDEKVGYGLASLLQAKDEFELHLIFRDEMDSQGASWGQWTRIMNSRTCLGYFKYAQDAIHLRRDVSTRTQGRQLGVVRGNSCPPERVPFSVIEAVVYVANIRYQTPPTRESYTTQDAADMNNFRKTVGHEILHCINLPDVSQVTQTSYSAFWNRGETPQTFSISPGEGGQTIMLQGLYVTTQGLPAFTIRITA